MTKILLTGARGFVGRQIAAALAKEGAELHVVTSTAADQSVAVGTWHLMDLMEQESVNRLLDAIRPTHLVHAAWDTTHGRFWTSDKNYDWVRASIALIQAFQRGGGQRLTMLGSCAEYDWTHGYCSEHITPLNPASPYGVSKAALFRLSEAFAASHGLSLAWARIFLVYGPHEFHMRLVPSIARSLLAGQEALCSDGTQIRDIMHVEDAGRAIAALALSDTRGPVNIGCGQPVALADVARTLAVQIGRSDLLRLGALPSRPGDPPLLLPDTRRLNSEVGFTPRYDLDAGLAKAVAYWRDNLPADSFRTQK